MKKLRSLSDWFWVTLGLALIACGACAPVTPYRPACTALDQAAIEAAYVAEAVKACRAEGAKSLDTCAAAGPIREKYRAQRAAWVECIDRDTKTGAGGSRGIQ